MIVSHLGLLLGWLLAGRLLKLLLLELKPVFCCCPFLSLMQSGMCGLVDVWQDVCVVVVGVKAQVRDLCYNKRQPIF